MKEMGKSGIRCSLYQRFDYKMERADNPGYKNRWSVVPQIKQGAI